MSEISDQMKITISGNPGKPRGADGEKMLLRMNDSHGEVTKWAFDFLQVHEGDRILDIGCGGGAALSRLSERITSGHLTGIDYSGVSVEMSQKWNAEDIEKGKMDIIKGSVEELPFEDESFDKIVSVESLYFWPDPAENLKEVFRVLKKGGVFMPVLDVYKKEGLDESILQNVDRFNMFIPTRDEFRSLMENAGFTDIKIHTQEGTDWICVEGRKA